MTEPSNRYCGRLRIPPPTVEAAAARPDVNLFLLMVVALLERGSPMRLDEIVARLERAALPPRHRKGDLHAVLRKAWHGQPPIVRDTGDRLALDLLHYDWPHLLFSIGSRPPLVAPLATLDVPEPPDTVSLSAEEVEAAFKGRWLYACSTSRQAAAVLEAAGESLTVEAINARLFQLTPHTGGIRDDSIRSWRSDLIAIDAAGSLRMNPASAAAPAFRREIRRMARPRLRAAADRAHFETQRRRVEEAQKAEEQRELEDARAARRALVHIVPGGAAARAAALIDAQGRSLRVCAGDDGLRELAATLESFDLLAGVDLRPSLRALGLDPERWLLAELRPSDRTHRPTDRVRITVTLNGIVRATTGASRGPAGPEAWQRMLDTGRRAAIERRLVSEAQSLFALYEYGVLHGGVRVRGRPGDRLLPVAWGMRGDPDAHSILDAAERTWTPLDAVFDPPVGRSSRPAEHLPDPWARARRVDVVERDWPYLMVREADQLMSVDVHGLFALRVTTPSAAARLRPRHSFSFDGRVCQVKVTLEGIDPPIWRRLVVPVWMTLDRLHAVLQASLGWTDSHLHVFEIDGERIGVPYEPHDLVEIYTRSGRLVRLLDVVERDCRRFVYEYDFGDSWRHEIEIEDVREPGDEGGVRCVDGARACPPEDCGGIGGYARLLEILFDPTHEEFDESREWVGPDFEPERFDLRAINARLMRLD